MNIDDNKFIAEIEALLTEAKKGDRYITERIEIVLTKVSGQLTPINEHTSHYIGALTNKERYNISLSPHERACLDIAVSRQEIATILKLNTTEAQLQSGSGILVAIIEHNALSTLLNNATRTHATAMIRVTNSTFLFERADYWRKLSNRFRL